MFKRKRNMLCLLTMLLGIVILLCACVPKSTPENVIFGSLIDLSVAVSETKDSDVYAENEYLQIIDVISITPTNVAVYGQLTEEAIDAGVTSVRVTGGAGTDVQEACIDDYFIIPFNLPGNSKATFAATAMKEEEEVGDPLTFVAPYDSTAEPRLDGKSVSVGRDSRLYFSKYLDDYLSKELYTASQVSEIKATVTSTYKAYSDRANGEEVDMIYVFIPDITTMDPSILLEEDAALKNENLLTRYEQVVSAVSSTKAKVVDMKEILQEQLDSGASIYDLYRLTDSHPTEYASFLMYQEVMKYIAAKDSDVVPHTLDEYTIQQVQAIGGDYVSSRELDPNIVTETVSLLQPNFTYREEVSSIKLYNDPANGDYSLFTEIDSTDAYTGGAERTLITTDRTELPNVLIYRDENGIAASLMIAESCDQTLLARVGDYFISLTDAGQYRDKEEGKSVMDFIVIFVSESDIPDAFDLGL